MKLTRTEAREKIMIILYQIDLYKKEHMEYNVEDVIKENLEIDNKYVHDIVYGVLDNQEKIDSIINKYMEKWTLDRLGKTDASILRLATYEMLYYDTPQLVVLNEAIELAKKYSDDKANSENGGDLGYFNLDEMVSEFSDAVKELKKDEYTKEPVKTEYGYHIILKTGEKDKAKLKTIKKDIIEKIKTQKLNDDPSLYYKALRGFREDNKIKWNDDTLKKAYNDYVNDLIDSANSSSSNQ